MTFLNTARAGSAHKDANMPVNSFFLGIGVSAGYFFFQLFMFSLLRRILGNIYQARIILYKQYSEYRNNKEHLNKTIFEKYKNYIPDLLLEHSDSYENTVGLDGVLFLRFLRFLMLFFVTIGLMNMPILIPLHYFSGVPTVSSSKSQNEAIKTKMATTIDMINMSNISVENSELLVVHFILSTFLVVWFHVILLTELKAVHKKINIAMMREKYQNVVFFNNIPKSYLRSNSKIFSFFNNMHDQCIVKIERVPRDIFQIRKKHRKLEHEANNIEISILKILLEKFFRIGYRLFENKDSKVEINSSTLMVLAYHQLCQDILFKLRCPERFFPWILELKKQHIKIFIWKMTVPQLHIKKRPILVRHYNTLDCSISRYHSYLNDWVQTVDGYNSSNNNTNMIDVSKYLNKAFITFTSPVFAHWIAEHLKNSAVSEWNGPIIGPNPEDIIWFNIMGGPEYLMLLRKLIAFILSLTVILGWVLPVAFIGLITQIPYLTSLIPYSDHVYVNSKIVREITKAVFPLVTLIFLTEFVPYIFRVFSYLKGCRTGAEIEQDIQRWFFIFLLVHIFLVVTISSGISILFEKVVVNPVSIPAILAHDLPQSSNFFCSFVLLRGFAYAGGNLIRIKELFFEIIYYRPKMQSPHEKMRRLKNNITFQWGSIYPLFTVLGCIGIIYSIISPLILPLCIISFILVYYSFKYLFKYHCTTKNVSETHGKLYPQALSQLYAGIYCMEFCLVGLFALFNKYKLCTAMILVSVLTLMAHVEISKKCINKLQYIHLSEMKNVGENGTPIFNNEEWTSFILPPITDKIWVPSDPLNIVITEKKYLQTDLCLKCDFDRAYVSKFGNICVNPVY